MKPRASAAAPAANPDIVAALQQLQSKINAEGEIRYTVTSVNKAKDERMQYQYATQSGNVLIDAEACAISVEARMSKDGELLTKGRDTIRLRDVTALTVKSQSRLILEKLAATGKPGWGSKVAPESYALETLHGGHISGIFFVHKEETANQMAEMVSRVTKLCGGKTLLP